MQEILNSLGIFIATFIVSKTNMYSEKLDPVCFHIYTFNIFSIPINSDIFIMEFYKSVSAWNHYAVFQNTIPSTARDFHWLSTTIFNELLHGRKLPIWKYFAFD